jgi:uncharacterized glyoxalase superfamily protein PhnB
MNAPIWPNLGYRDARAAIRFLVEAFGFEELAVYDDPGGSIGHATLRWPGGGGVMLHTADGSSVASLTAHAGTEGGYPPYSVHIATDDPDGLFKRAVEAGAAVIREPEDSPFGTRSFIVTDPEGLYWTAGTELPELVRDAQGNWRPPDQ